MATQLRIFRATLDRHQTAGDISLMAAGYRRTHKLRSLFIGLPASLKPARGNDITGLKDLALASKSTRDALAPLFSGRALSEEDVVSITEILRMDARMSALTTLQTSLSTCAQTPSLSHPLYPQWAELLESMNTAFPRKRTLSSKLARMVEGKRFGFWSLTAFGGSFLGLATIPFFRHSQVFPSVALAALSLFGVSAALALLHAIADEPHSEPTEAPSSLWKRIMTLGASEEADLIVFLADRGALTTAAFETLNECLDLREAMRSALYVDTPHTTSGRQDAERPNARRVDAPRESAHDD